MQKTILRILLPLWLLAGGVFGFEVPDRPNQPVLDLAGMLSSGDVQELSQRLQSYRDSTSIEIGVLTIQTLDGVPIEDYAHEVFKKWGIGKDSADNGVLLLIALAEHKTRIEVGYGLEGALTDAESNRIVNKSAPMAGYFRQGDFAGGINAAIDGIMIAVGGDYIVYADQHEKKDQPSFPQIVFWLIFAVVMINILRGLFHKGGPGNGIYRGGRGFGSGLFWGGLGGFGLGRGGFGGGSGGGGGGGFGGFGGGSSGGGGASGGW